MNAGIAPHGNAVKRLRLDGARWNIKLFVTWSLIIKIENSGFTATFPRGPRGLRILSFRVVIITYASLDSERGREAAQCICNDVFLFLRKYFLEYIFSSRNTGTKSFIRPFFRSEIGSRRESATALKLINFQKFSIDWPKSRKNYRKEGKKWKISVPNREAIRKKLETFITHWERYFSCMVA